MGVACETIHDITRHCTCTLSIYKIRGAYPTVARKESASHKDQNDHQDDEMKILVGAFGTVWPPVLISVVVKHTNMAIGGNIRGPD